MSRRAQPDPEPDRPDPVDARPPAGPARGVLAGDPAPGPMDHRRVRPCRGLASWLEHFWWVQWSLSAPHTVQTLPHPSVHWVFEPTPARRAHVLFPSTKPFTRRLEGDGWVFGIKFRPAMFSPWVDGAVGAHTGDETPVTTLLGPDAAPLVDAIFAAESLEARVHAAEAFLMDRVGPVTRELASLRDLIERIATDRSLIRAADAAEAHGVGLRTLEALFRRHVGVTPKWVIRRYRLHEAAARLSERDPPSLAALASDLGYADQAHFTRDFKAATGRTPGAYLRANEAGQP